MYKKLLIGLLTIGLSAQAQMFISTQNGKGTNTTFYGVPKFKTAVEFSEGTETDPSIYPNGDLNTGIYWFGNGITGISSGGSAVAAFDNYTNTLVSPTRFATVTPNTAAIFDSDGILTNSNKGLDRTFPLPYSAGVLYNAFGDSHTAGQVSNNYLGTNWVTNVLGTAFIIPEYRYPNIISNTYGLQLTNYGVGGSGMLFATNSNFQRRTPFNQFGRNMPVSWKGLVTVMQGYNNATTGFVGNDWNPFWLAGQESFIARALLNGYVAGGTAGLTETGASYASFATDGANFIETGWTDNNPFPVGNPTTDQRTLLELTGSEYFSFSTTNKNNIAIFWESSDAGGTASVYNQDGVVVANVETTVPFGDTNRVAGVVVLRNLASSSTITVTNTSGTTRWFGVGFLADPPANDRFIILGTTPYVSSTRNQLTLNNISRAAVRATETFADWNVAVADTGNALNPSVDVNLSLDTHHPGPSGQAKWAQAFMAARQPDFANLTAGYWISLVQQTVIGDGTSFAILQLNGAEGTPRGIDFNTEGTSTANQRWRVSANSNLETGANDGSDFVIQAYSDTGVLLGNSIFTKRSTRDTTISGNTTLEGTLSSLSTTVGDGAGDEGTVINGGAGQIRYLDFNSAGLLRWRVRANNTAESGANAGSDFQILAYNDAGTLIGSALQFDRATRLGTVSGGLTVNGTLYTPNSVIIGDGTSAKTLGVAGAAGNIRAYDMYSGVGTSASNLRIRIRTSADAESGANAGSNFQLNRYSDAGSLLGSWIIGFRDTGHMLFGGNTTNTGVIVANGDVITSGNGDSSASLVANGAAGNLRITSYDTAASPRWRTGANNVAESGSNVGSDYTIQRFNDAGTLQDSPITITRSTGNVTAGADGTSFRRIKHGVATLVGGTIVVNDTSVTANSRIFLTSNVDGGTVGFVRVSARSAGASFTITSSNVLDTSTIAWMLVEP